MLTANVFVASRDRLSKPHSPTIYNILVVPQESTYLCYLQMLSLMLFCYCLTLVDSALSGVFAAAGHSTHYILGSTLLILFK